tara:strand:- start:7750 stop:8712 length:963 start_codon:yes stop_codon:yes gene_type:complete
MLFQRDHVRQTMNRLADKHGIYLGTSSWKYPDWCGLLYDEENYLHNRRFSKARFERECLREYAQTFRSVCVDATYYRYPKESYLHGLAEQVPAGFKLSFKVPDDITIKTYPELKAFGGRAGKPNHDFLDVAMARYGFLRMLEPIRDQVGLIAFEFSHFGHDDFERGRDFVDALDRFFQEMPDGWQFGVEVRNRNLLHPAYFEMLSRHGVAHIYNQWTHMPSVREQLEISPLQDQPFVAARFLISEGRPHAWAREKMAPFNRIYEVDPDSRATLQQMLDWLGANRQPGNPSSDFLYIGNELEGCGLHTLADVVETCDWLKV